MGENESLLLNDFVNNNPINTFDYIGLWQRKKEGSHIWVAGEDDESLSEIFNNKNFRTEYGDNILDRYCLWPVEGTKDNGYPDKIKPCDGCDWGGPDIFCDGVGPEKYF